MVRNKQDLNWYKLVSGNRCGSNSRQLSTDCSLAPDNRIISQLMACPYITVTCKVLPSSCPGVYPSCSELKQIEFVKGLFITSYTVLFCVRFKIKWYLIFLCSCLKKVCLWDFLLKFSRFDLISKVCESVASCIQGCALQN